MTRHGSRSYNVAKSSTLPPPTVVDDAFADAAVQVADQLGVRLGQLPERAVQERDVETSPPSVSVAGSKPSRSISAVERLRARPRAGAAAGFDAPRPPDRGGFVAVGADALGERGEQTGEQRVAGRVEAEAGRAGRERVDVLRAADGAAVDGLDLDETGLAQALEVQADGVGVEAEPVGELGRA